MNKKKFKVFYQSSCVIQKNVVNLHLNFHTIIKTIKY